MKALSVLLLPLLLAACASAPPWVGEGEPIVRPGEYKRTIKFHFYETVKDLRLAWRNDMRVPANQKDVAVDGFAFAAHNEVHAVMPTVGDALSICILGHEVLHELTHAYDGQWHFPFFGGQECYQYQDEEN